MSREFLMRAKSRRVTLLGWLVVLACASSAASAATTLDQNCVINVLNRTVQVSPQGGWSLPNVPSNMGQIRARATCTQGTQTISGQTDYFSVLENGTVSVGDVQFEQQEQVPVSLSYTDTGTNKLTTVGATHQLAVTAKYPDNSVRDVTASSNGINYRSTNPTVASVNEEGLVTAHSSGTVLITARKDEVVAIKQILVDVAGDKDGDGLPDDYELTNGLDPNDPIDAHEDQDGDGLTALQEFQHGTGVHNADSDADGLNDGEEVTPGADGFTTNPLNADTDGDGLNDKLEVLAGSSPTDGNDHNISAVLDRITVSPPTATLTFNALDTEVSTRLVVTGVLIDGSTIDLTAKRLGTTYTSSNLAVVSFSGTDGEIFGGTAGDATVTVTNSGKQFGVTVHVVRFQPTALAAIAIPGYANNVDVSGNFAFVAAGSAGLQVVDVTDRAHPAIVSNLDTDGVAIDIRVFGKYAYIADGEAGLKIIDVSNPLAPVLAAAVDTGGIAQDLKVADQFVYLADGAGGVQIFDVHDPTHPVAKGHLEGIGETFGIDAQGNRAVVVSDTSLFVLDVTDRAAPSVQGTLNIGPVKDVVLNGDYAYVAVFTTGYRVVRLTDPTAPAITGGDARFAPRDVELSDGLAFFAEQIFPNVIAVVNARDPERPTFQSTIDLSPLGDYAGTGIALDGSYAYVTEEATVVGTDIGVTGNTRLFIAQYRSINDTGGVPPAITVRSPEAGATAVEGSTVIADVDATDDIGVKSITVAVDGVAVGTRTSRPYQLPVTVPFDKSSITVSATATDFGGNTSSAQVTVQILKDSDRDGLSDDLETTLHHTDAHDADTDHDGLSDGREVALGTNPLVADTDGDGIGDQQEVDAGTDPLNADATAPSVVATDPAANATNVLENHAIAVTFSEPLRPASIKSDSIKVLLSGVPAAGKVRLMPNGVDLVFTPSGLLGHLSQYTVVVSGVRDTAGNPLAAPFQFIFTTGNALDTTPPQVVATTPATGTNDVATNTIISMLMNEPIDPLSVNATTFVARDSEGVLAGTARLAEDARTIVFSPNAPLAVHRLHTVGFFGVKDLAGNSANSSFTFTTSFAADATPPRLLSTSMSDGQTVPTNATVSVRFDEPISRVTLGGVMLKQGSTLVSTQQQVTVSAAGTEIKLIPATSLSANTSYVFSIAGVQDLSGNVQTTPRTVSFTTGSGPDTAAPTLVRSTPLANATGVPLNVRIEAALSERVNPVTLNATTVLLSSPNSTVPGTVSLSPDGTAVRFVPNRPLAPNTSYTFTVSFLGAEDQAGNRFSASFKFVTGTSSDVTPPVVQLQSLADGATAVPINGRIILRFDAPLADQCVNNATVQLTTGGAPVAGAATLSADRRTLTFAPQAALAASTAYTLRLTGVCDLAGNTLNDFVSGFTTSDIATADTTKPTVTITPAQSAVNVPVTTPIVFTFSEPFDVTTLAGSLQVTVSGVQGEVAGNLQVDGTVVTFTSLEPLPGNKTINVVVNGVSDLAGNVITTVNRSFTTGSGGDTTAPRVISMTPNDGSVDVQGSPIVLTFSESLDPATVNTTNFAVIANGDVITTGISRSTDSRTIVLTAAMPANGVVSVVATHDVRDLSGNALADFVGAFTTSPPDTIRPTFTSQFPGSGASDVLPDAPIVLIASEPLNAATVPQALRVSQNGALIQGAVTVSSTGRVVTFQPSQPFARGALIEVFADSTLLDASGNPLSTYQASFRMAPDPAASPPVVTGFAPSFPANTTVGMPINAVIDILFSEPLDPATVNSSTVVLKAGASAPPIAADITLTHGNQIVRVRPQSPLAPSQQHLVSIQTGVKDTTGTPLSFATTLSFATSAAAVPDEVAPHLQIISPPNGATGVGINAPVHARFDEPINPFTLALSPQQTVFGSVFWSSTNREVRFVRHRPYEPNTQVTESVAGAEDYAGNVVVEPNSTTFTTGTGPAATVTVVDSTPPAARNDSGQPITVPNMPLSLVVRVRFSGQVDPVDVADGLVRVSGPPTTASLEDDGRTVALVPTTPYAPGHTFGITVGTPIGVQITTFSTGFAVDTQPPVVAATSIQDGETGVPTNAVLQVRFNEPISPRLSGVVLRQGGQVVPATLDLSGDRTVISFKLLQLLSANTTYQLSVSGVPDLSNNVGADRVVTFTTGVGADFIAAAVQSHVPTQGATGVPLNPRIEVTFSDAINAVTATSTSVTLTDPQGRPASGTISFSSDGRTIRFQPDQPLVPLQNYRFQVVGNVVQDLIGRFVADQFSFTTGTTSDTAAPQVLLQSIADGAAAVPVNGRFVLKFDSALADRCVNGQTVQLSTGGVTVAGVLTLSTDRTQLTFTPSAALGASTAYTLRLQGLCDLAGNVLDAFTSGFTTSSSATPDTTAPALTTIVPAANATNVPVTTDVTLTFNEPVDVTSLAGSIQLLVSGVAGEVASNISVNGGVVSVTPLSPLPGNKVITVVMNGVKDLAGNVLNTSRAFTTGAAADTTAPQLLSVSPASGLVGVAPGTPIVLTFSESLDPATAVAANIGLFVNGAIVQPTISRSTDNRTLVLTANLPTASVVSVIATNDVKDLSGNRLADFVSAFTTAVGGDGTTASVVAQFPTNGASSIRRNANAVLYVSKPLAPESVTQAIHVAQDGVLVPGTVSLSGNGQALTFHPDQPFGSNALIEIFLDNTARDTTGFPVFTYSGNFHTRVDAASSPPSALSLSAGGITGGVPVNAALDVLFSEPLDPASVTPANFVLRDFSTNQIVASTASLIKGGRVVRVQPQTPMAASHTHSIQVQTGVRDLNGQGPAAAQSLFFLTNTVAVADTESPHVLAKGPADGASGVGINSQTHWRFDEPMNPLSLVQDPDAAVTLFWSDNNRDLRIARDEPYAANATVTDSIADAQDNAANAVLGSVSTTFTTGSAANVTRPNRVDSTPFSAATNVPVNAVVHVLFDTMVDPVTVNTSTSFLRDSQTGTNVPASAALEMDGRTITIVPTQPLANSHTFTIHTDSIADLSGNVNQVVATSSFTTSSVPDTQPPTVTAISLADGQGNVPTNAPLSVTFSEPVNALKLSGVTLRQNGQPVPATLNVSADHRTLTFKLVQPLTANTVYALSVSSVEDLSGNALAQASAVGFTTGPGADL